MNEALLVIDGWSVATSQTAESARQAIIDVLHDVQIDEIPVNSIGQAIADEIAVALGQAKTFRMEVERVSAELRKPYFEHAKRIKALSDAFSLPVAALEAALGNKLAEYEAEKKRIEQALDRQRRAEEEACLVKQREAELERQRLERVEMEMVAAAERERLHEAELRRREIEDIARRAEQAKAEQATALRASMERKLEEAKKLEAAAQAKREEETRRMAESSAQRERERLAEQQQQINARALPRYEPPVTRGVQVKIAYEYEVEDVRAFASWCWTTGKTWVNEITFYRREIMEFLNSSLTTDQDRRIPGLRVFQSVGTNVTKPREKKPLDVQTRKIEM